LTSLRSAVKREFRRWTSKSLPRKNRRTAGKAAFKGYRGYPCVLCTSVNSEIVHRIPSPKRKLRESDIVSIDFGMEVDGYYADSAVTSRWGDSAGAAEAPGCDPGIAGSRDRQNARGQPVRRCRPRGAEAGSSKTVFRWCVSSSARIGTKMHDEPNLPN